MSVMQWNVRVMRGQAQHIGQVAEDSEALARCAALSLYGVTEDEVDAGEVRERGGVHLSRRGFRGVARRVSPTGCGAAGPESAAADAAMVGDEWAAIDSACGQGVQVPADVLLSFNPTRTFTPMASTNLTLKNRRRDRQAATTGQ